MTIAGPESFTLTEDKVDDYGTAFTRVGVHLHLAKSSKVVMTFKKVYAQ